MQHTPFYWALRSDDVIVCRYALTAAQAVLYDRVVQTDILRLYVAEVRSRAND